VVALVELSLLAFFFGMGWLYLVCAVVAGVWFILQSWRLMCEPSKQTAMATFRASLLHFALLSVGVILDRALAWLVLV
jgi:protoheme IX farnesyltransferase